MKIAAYTIAKNEAQFLSAWRNATKDADYSIIVDTGSIDGTEKEADHHISLRPWRFDDARNAALALVPPDADVCIALDMDEVLVPGWREALEKSWTEDTTRLRYPYIWSWNQDGSPGLTYYGDKIHSRHGYRWKHPVHEVLHRKDEVQTFTDDLRIEHYPDSSKPRSQYLPLLKLAVEEDPHDDRNAFYYGRELHFYGIHVEAIKELERHLMLPRATWAPERAASWRYMARSNWALKNYAAAIDCYEQAIAEAPDQREGYVELAQAHRAFGRHREVIENCEKALAIRDRPKTYICEDTAWSDWPEVMLNEAKQCLLSST